MVDFWIWWVEFTATSPFLATTLAFWVLVIAYFLVVVVARLFGRVLRMVMVALHGWPPAHLDADGDWRPAPKGDE